jgi:ribosomal protein L21E
MSLKEDLRRIKAEERRANSLSLCEESGKSCFFAGRSIDANPHRGQNQRASWEHGWKWAQRYQIEQDLKKRAQNLCAVDVDQIRGKLQSIRELLKDMTKFHIGDTVRIIRAPATTRGRFDGRLGTVSSTEKNGLVTVRINGAKGQTLSCFVEGLKLIRRADR